MIFLPTDIEGAYIIKIEKNEDERGFFARTYDVDIFNKNKLDSKIVQCNVNYTKQKGTLKGLHYQISPYEETKLIRCIRGSVCHVIVDLRPTSSTYKKWESIVLSQDEYCWRYIPKGCANGIQTLDDDTELIYQSSQYYSPEHERGIRWDDPKLNIKWPIKPTVISQKDQSWKLL
jgi:dTDP-4-dehydrorhamnose 3,5-epimerase